MPEEMINLNDIAAESGGQRMSQQEYDGQQRDLVAPGVYTAKPIDWAFTTNSKGNKQLNVVLEFKEGDKTRRLYWFGHLTPLTVDKTLDTLVTLGCSCLDDEVLGKGREGGALDVNKPVEIVVKHETYEGKTTARIQWVNEVGAGGFKNRVENSKGVIPNFAALMKDALAKRGAQAKQQPPTENVEVPF